MQLTPLALLGTITGLLLASTSDMPQWLTIGLLLFILSAAVCLRPIFRSRPLLVFFSFFLIAQLLYPLQFQDTSGLAPLDQSMKKSASQERSRR